VGGGFAAGVSSGQGAGAGAGGQKTRAGGAWFVGGHATPQARWFGGRWSSVWRGAGRQTVGELDCAIPMNKSTAIAALG
jgi:hypothetical protein